MTWQDLSDRASALIQQEAHDPTRYQPLMHEVEVLLLDIADLMADLNRQRYYQEREYARVKNTTIGKYTNLPVTIARAHAEVAALEAREKADALKVIFHHAEDTQKALVAKHMALLNLNRGVQGFLGDGVRRG